MARSRPVAALDLAHSEGHTHGYEQEALLELALLLWMEGTEFERVLGLVEPMGLRREDLDRYCAVQAAADEEEWLERRRLAQEQADREREERLQKARALDVHNTTRTVAGLAVQWDGTEDQANSIACLPGFGRVSYFRGKGRKGPCVFLRDQNGNSHRAFSGYWIVCEGGALAAYSPVEYADRFDTVYSGE